MGWSVSIRDRVLVNGMGCYLPRWRVSKQCGVLLFGMGC